MENKQDYSQVEVFLNFGDLGLRSSVNTVLLNNGFRSIALGKSLKDMASHLKHEMPDLMICGTQFSDGELSPKIHQMRHNKWGPNPFMPIITVATEPDPKMVKAVIESGADDLLVQPISTQKLLDRINVLIQNRKQFVVTTDYVGPDRRGKDHSDGKEIPRIDVPNSLKTKVTGEGRSDDLASAIAHALEEINLQKVERHGDQIVYLVEHILDLDHSTRPKDKLAVLMKKLIAVTEEARVRMESTKFAHTSTLCKSLLQVATGIRDGVGYPSEKDMQLLHPLAQAIQVGFSDTEAAKAATSIADTVGKVN
jgi:DNA-binding response OmpR family regulator